MNPVDLNSQRAAHLDADRVAYFDALMTGFCRAGQAVGGVEDRVYMIGGHAVRLRFAGRGLIPPLTRALAHLAIEARPATALTVNLWDSASTGVGLPLLARDLVDLVRLRWFERLDGRHEIKGYDSPRIRTTFHLGPDILSALDTERATAVYWVNDAAALPYYERGYPLQNILNWWAESHALHFVHAGAVGLPSGGVLVAGAGGSGKSSTCLTCGLAGMAFAGDDYSLVTLDPAPYAYSLYNTSKLRAEVELNRYPGMRSWLANGDRLADEKPMFFFREQFPDRVALGFPLKAILLPRVTGQRDTSLEPAAPMTAFRLIAPSTLLQLSGTGQPAFSLLSRLVRRVPAYTLHLGTDTEQIPHAITALLANLP